MNSISTQAQIDPSYEFVELKQDTHPKNLLFNMRFPIRKQELSSFKRADNKVAFLIVELDRFLNDHNDLKDEYLGRMAALGTLIAFQKESDAESTLSQLEIVLRHLPKSVSLLTNYGVHLYEHKQYKQAIENLKKAIHFAENKTQKLMLSILTAKMCYEQSRFDEAFKIITQCPPEVVNEPGFEKLFYKIAQKASIQNYDLIKHCVDCGNLLFSKSMFCTNCGSKNVSAPEELNKLQHMKTYAEEDKAPPSPSDNIDPKAPIHNHDQKRFCVNCSKPLTPDSVYCTNCGSSLE